MKSTLHFFRTIGFILVLLAFAQQASAQVEEETCFFTDSEIPEERCIAIGYSEVTPYVNQPGDPPGQQLLNVTIIFQACEDVTEIRISRPGGQPIIITGDDITGEVQDTTFLVNARPFQNKNDLRLSIEFITGERESVDIVYTGEEVCENILEEIFPLPVELVSFAGKATQRGIDLIWRTASELNNSHFEVERSTDGKVFSQIGKVNGNGTSSLVNEYKFGDTSPADGINYYRLKQVDFDGQYAYSNIIALSVSVDHTLGMTLAPNPCQNGDCSILLRTAPDSETTLQLKDMTGKLVFSKTIVSSGNVMSIAAPELKNFKGLYILTATSGGQVTHQRLVLD